MLLDQSTGRHILGKAVIHGIETCTTLGVNVKYVIIRPVDNNYFTGEDTRNGKEGHGTWLPFPKFAKIYVKRAWAPKAALKWAGNVLDVEDTRARFA